MKTTRAKRKKICENTCRNRFKKHICFQDPEAPVKPASFGPFLRGNSDKESSHVVGKLLHSGA